MFLYVMVCEAETMTPMTKVGGNNKQVLGIVQEGA